ncbi:MAG: efflux RND transporter periplasmic adaptor subunit [Polyangiaceae bacterium]|jgi:HlyD family secretion protein|nr:efflux RND transporter periplasmic adaptor subunit [Polyangiaceae bacterium]
MIRGTSAMDRPALRPRPARYKLLSLAALTAALALGAAFGVPFARRWAGAERAIDASRVRVAEVVRGDLERDVSVQGRVVASLHPTLYSPSPGIVTMLVKVGAEVTKGQALAKVDSPELTSRWNQEQATLRSLQAELDRQQIAMKQAAVRTKQATDVFALKHAAAERALKRTKSLRDEGLTNASELEKAQDDFEIATLEYKNARESSGLEVEALQFEGHSRRQQVQRQQAVVDELTRQIAELTVAAPFDGMVASWTTQDRDAVGRNQALLSVVNLAALELEVELPENYASDVRPGTRAEVSVQGKLFAGKVVSVSPQVRDGQVRANVAFEPPAPAGLRQSERLSTRLVLDRRVGVLKLPRGPFLESGGGRQVYVVEGGVATPRPVQAGAVSVSEVELASGLREGERVVVSDTGAFEGARAVLLRP